MIAKCCNKKNIKKKAEAAIATFLPIEEDKTPLISFKINLLITEDKFKRFDLLLGAIPLFHSLFR
ncbi:hypothetical protein GCM10011397_03150 [Wenyingzhuangia marina]|nr:hypothetical protein GCM10011397_03150 [Wenyingzhuangia marina]